MEIAELIKEVKELDDTKLTEFLKGLGVYDENGQKAEIAEVKDAGIGDTANLDKEISEEQAIAKTEEANPTETKAEAHAEVEGAAGAVEEETAKPVDKEHSAEEKATEEIKSTDNRNPAEEKSTEPPTDNAGDIDGKDEEIPAMVRGVDAPPEDAPAEQTPPQPTPEMPAPAPVTADNGQPIPTDFESIISGLNAKNAALESENAILRTKAEKVDAAFGYMARPPEPVKMANSLYDPNFNVKMHR
jgi:hypothetical protein